MFSIRPPRYNMADDENDLLKRAIYNDDLEMAKMAIAMGATNLGCKFIMLMTSSIRKHFMTLYVLCPLTIRNMVKEECHPSKMNEISIESLNRLIAWQRLTQYELIMVLLYERHVSPQRGIGMLPKEVFIELVYSYL